ncbi:DUF2190 family protein [Rhodobacteraceae bacterium CCMM004]|nr:DUF2190 family protein [Rhodobacteraceae bacterium CCMM004]
MATNYVQRGENLTITGPAATGGEPVFEGAIVGVALHSALAGQPIDVATHGVWEMPKVAADEIGTGDVIYWDDSVSLATTTETGNNELGVAVAAAAVDAATVNVRIRAF